jgi:NAD(P)-dependent dehydrogenase (short-subunit alcohol dehydrogenase family)
LKALVLGANGSIGAALVEQLKARLEFDGVVGVSRTSHPTFDLEQAASFAPLASSLASQGPFDLVFDATGVLTLDGVGPEKALRSVDGPHLQRLMQINAIGPLLLWRELHPLMSQGPSVYAKLSARVGSISDNQKGGWYGYRASKAALNMLLQTTAIELQRKNSRLHVFALQPGTVRSTLSAAFTAGYPDLLEPQESAARLLKVILERSQLLVPEPVLARSGAHFVDHLGADIPW